MPETGRLLLEAILNGLWQGVLLALAVSLILRVAPNVGAGTRHAIWVAILVAMVALPALYVVRHMLPLESVPPPLVSQEFDVEASFQLPVADSRSFFPIEVPSGDIAWVLLGVWFAGTAGMIVFLAASYVYLGWLKSLSEPARGRLGGWVDQWSSAIGPGRTARTCITTAVRLPIAAGLLRPVILFPRSLADELDQGEAHDVWLHELAHFRRWDDWTTLGQRLVQAVLFFHPAVHWIGRRMSLERELACDEWVVSRTGKPRSYAACLAKLAAMRSPHPAPALGMAAYKKQIFRRVEMLMSQSKNGNPRRTRFAPLVLSAFVAATVALFAAFEPVIVLAHPATPVPAPPAAQAQPTPPEPPTPAPAPAAVPQPRPSPRPSPADREEMAELREQMRAVHEELRKAASEMRAEVRANIHANAQEIRELSLEIREKVQNEIRPQVEEIQRLHQQIREATPDKEAMAKLEAQIAEIERNSIRGAELDIRELENQIRAYEEKMGPSEEVIRKLEEKVRTYEEKMRNLERELRRRYDERPDPPEPPEPPEL